MKKILVTGSNGFIGSHLVDELCKQDYEVYSMDNSLPQFGNKYINPKAHRICGDVRNFESVNFATKNIDIVVHLAAISHISTCLEDPKIAFETNIIGTTNVLEACRKNNVKKVVVASSDHIYGKSPRLPANEDTNDFDALYDTGDVYGKTKAIQAITARMYYDLYRLPVIITASGNVFSSRQSIPNVVPSFIINALTNKDLVIHGNGDQTRDIYYISNLIDGYIRCIESNDKCNGELFNFGSGKETSINQIAWRILELVPETQSKITYINDTKLNAMNRMYLDTNKAKRMLDWRIKISLDEGLRMTVDEMRNNG